MDNKTEILEEDRSIRRMNRQKYIFENLKVIAILASVFLIAMLFRALFGIILIFATIGAIGYSLYLNACRMHDIGFSGLWQIPFIIINAILTFALQMPILTQIINVTVTLALLIIKGTDGPNKFGEDPLLAAPQYVYEQDN